MSLPETISRNIRRAEETNATSDKPNDVRHRLKQTEPYDSVKLRRAFAVIGNITLTPFKAFTLLKYPPVFLTIYLDAVGYGALYVLYISLQYTFSRPPYTFASWILGFIYAPLSIGVILSIIFAGPWVDRIMRREAIKANRYDEDGQLVYLPEDRMRENAWLAVSVYNASLAWYGWSAQNGVMWVGLVSLL